MNTKYRKCSHPHKLFIAFEINFKKPYNKKININNLLFPFLNLSLNQKQIHIILKGDIEKPHPFPQAKGFDGEVLWRQVCSDREYLFIRHNPALA